MHQAFRQALPGAYGVSQHVVALIADIRGFTAFSSQRDSADVGTYITTVYERLLERYFGDFDDVFFKPTGDGLLVVVPYDSSNVTQVIPSVVSACLKAHDGFSEIVTDVSMVNFETPTRLGIGLSQGAASAIKADSVPGFEHTLPLVLDYSGAIINAASRLQDLARPSGVILDGSVRLELLSEVDQARFETQELYVRSIAEGEPRLLHLQRDAVQVPEANRVPLSFSWKSATRTTTIQLLRAATHYTLGLADEVDPASVLVRVTRTTVDTAQRIVWKVAKKHYVIRSVGPAKQLAIRVGKARDDDSVWAKENENYEEAVTFIVHYQGR